MEKNKSIIRIIILLALILFQSISFAQTNIEKEIDSTITQFTKENKLDSLAIYTRDLSIYYYKNKDYFNAIKYVKKELSLGLQIIDTARFKKSLFNLGFFYFKNKQFHNSIKTHQKVIDSFEIDARSYLSYCEIGRNYSELGDFHQAIIYYEKGLEQPELFSGRNLSVNYRNLSSIYDLGDTNIKDFLSKKFNLLQKIDSLNKIINPDDNTLIKTNIGFGDYYTNDEVFDFKKTNYYFKKALKIALKNNDSINIALLHNKIGYTYRYNKNDSCVYYLNQVLKYAKPNHPSLPQAYSNLAQFHAEKNQYNLALSNSHKELTLTLPEKIDTSFLVVPTIQMLAKSNNKFQAFYALKGKAKSFLEAHLTTKNKDYTTLSLKHLQLADELLDIIKLESIEKKSKLFWQQEASEIYMLAVKASLLLNDMDNAFYFMEKRKAILLLENLSESELKLKSNIDTETLEKESAFKQNIFTLENQLNDSYYTNKDSLKNIHNNYKIDYANFVKSLEDKYPEYYNYKIPAELSSLKKVRENLDNKTIIIEYVLDKNDGYVMYASKEKTELYRLDDIALLQTKIKSFNEIISKPFNTNSDKEQFNDLSNYLYDKLLPKRSSQIFNNKKKIIIVPDYILQTIPYETLLTNEETYLIRDFDIAYAYSISFLEKNAQINRNPENDIIGFAPLSFNASQNLNTLSYSKEELNAIAKSIDGTFLYDDLSTKENFMTRANDYKIIHLATHANSNDSITPWIAFKNKKLLLNELYTNKNQAELTVLSACNTALGEIKEGEGVFSLARGFFHSGSNSVVSSLWTVNDKSTTEITEAFYQNLKQGESKSEALRNAKLNYLDTHSLSETSPYYWASFILIGDSGTVELKQSNTVLYIVVFSIIALILIYLIYSKKTGNRSSI